MRYSERTLKKLFGLSGNQCAFPGCISPVIDGTTGLPIGEICHIKGKSPNGPRYDPNQSDSERNDYPNLLVMCPIHNKTVDDEKTRDQFPEQLLVEFKLNHEARFRNTLVTEDLLEKLIKLFDAFDDFRAKPSPVPSLIPAIEVLRTGVDGSASIDLYDFKIKLKNEGQSTVSTYRLEVEIPADLMPERSGSIDGEVKQHNRGQIRFFRRTERSHPGIEVYPGDTTDILYALNFEVPVDRYIAITGDEVLTVRVFVGDSLSCNKLYRIADLLSEDRCNQLWRRNEDRPAALQQPRKAVV